MPLDLEEVRRIAALARLQLESDEEELYAGQLSRIVDYFDRFAEAALLRVGRAFEKAAGWQVEPGFVERSAA